MCLSLHYKWTNVDSQLCEITKSAIEINSKLLYHLWVYLGANQGSSLVAFLFEWSKTTSLLIKGKFTSLFLMGNNGGKYNT